MDSILLKNFLAGKDDTVEVFVSLIDFMPLLGSELDKMPNLRPCNPPTTPPLPLLVGSTTASDLLQISLLTGTTGLFGGTGGGTPLPSAVFLFVEVAESVNGFLEEFPVD